MRERRTKAIQWSMAAIRWAKAAPSSQPAAGINAWKAPNQAPTTAMCRGRRERRDSPLQTATAKASIDRPTASTSSSQNPM